MIDNQFEPDVGMYRILVKALSKMEVSEMLGGASISWRPLSKKFLGFCQILN